ncbi:MAG: hypothetical protein K2K34_08110 [Oscillospiraceae bacterium]|nr:hypothetical protein [Oscillospiraceae bacterium]
MLNKKFLLGIILSMAVCLSACSNGNAEVTETSAESITEAAEITSAESESKSAVESISEPEPPAVDAEDVTEASYDTGNPETGLVYFIQPIIEQYDEYDDWSLADWECRDTEVLRNYHYDNEWHYRKELIFVFSNYTDEPVTVDSIQIVRQSDGAPVSFADGSNTLDIDFTVQPLHKTDYLLKAEDFDYSSCESGIYNAVVNVGLEGYGREFFIDNSELYEETFPSVFVSEAASDNWWGREYTGAAPAFLTEEQQKIFAEAHARISEFFWWDSFLPENYAETHTADDFIGLFTNVLTEDYVRQLSQGMYINDDGTLRIFSGGGRGSNIFYCGHCFFPVSSDDEQVTFKATVIYCHSDNPYTVGFEDINYHMVNTENGWRVDHFDLWN